jgi:TonB family protein
MGCLNRPKLMHKMRVLQGILLSLFIHFFLVWSSQFAPLIAAKLDSQAITVDIIDEETSQNKTQKQIVRETKVPEEAKARDSKDPLSFLSAEDQRVKKQTRAPEIGMTKNRTNEPINPDEIPPQPNKQQTAKAQKDPRTPGGLDPFTPQYKKTPATTRDLERGMSTVGEALPNDMAVGSFTALNTDRYLYYSFFSRIEEMIRFRWESAVENARDSAAPERFMHNVSGNWTTNMEVWLKPNGEIQSIKIMKESGFRGFDQAAKQAFLQARMFPNPPKEMVESDGLIKLKYSFLVRYKPNVLVKSRD